MNCTDPLGLEGSFYGDLNKIPWDGPLGPRGQLFFSGVGNLSIGVLSGVGVVGLSGATYGFGTVAAVTVFGHAAAFSSAKGVSQIAAAIAGTSQQQQGANSMPNNLSSTTGSNELEGLEAIYSLTAALQNISNALTIANSLNLPVRPLT